MVPYNSEIYDLWNMVYRMELCSIYKTWNSTTGMYIIYGVWVYRNKYVQSIEYGSIEQVCVQSLSHAWYQQ